MGQDAFRYRIFRCSQSDYYHNEIADASVVHTSARLAAIAEAGFTGVWLRAELRELAPVRLFGKYASNSKAYLQSLRTLCRRAGKHGLGIWLYFNEPLGIPQSHRFWRDHPTLGGPCVYTPLDPPVIALCASTHEVQDYLREGFRELYGQIPLAGAILITASEHPSHCWSYVVNNPSCSWRETFWAERCECPRCAPRGPVEVVADVIGLIHHGIKSARPEAEVVAWDWSWNMYFRPPYRNMIDRLPEDVILMGDFERGGVVSRAAKRETVEEYSLVYPGPSKRFVSEVAATAGRRQMWARIQINTTLELSTVPNLPLVVSLYRKFKYLQSTEVCGFMGTWNFSSATDTLNVFAATKLSEGRLDDDEQKCLQLLAEEYFGPGVDAPEVVRAWYGFQRACRHYPINGNAFVYRSPTSRALAYPLRLRFSGRAMPWTYNPDFLGDHLEDSLGDFSLSQVVQLLGRLSRAWLRALKHYEKGLVSADRTERARKELGVATVAGRCFQATYNIYRWYRSRRNKKSRKLSKFECEIVADEIENLRAALPAVESDLRLGFHEESHQYTFTAGMMREKLRVLEKLMRRQRYV